MKPKPIYFSIKQSNVTKCYSNEKLDYETLLDTLYHANTPYTALMQLDGNKPLMSADFFDTFQSEQSVCYDIDFDNDRITAKLPWSNQKMEEFSKAPFGAALSLLRIEKPRMTPFEIDEFLDMDELYGDNRLVSTKERGFLICSFEGRLANYVDYLRSTGNYPEIYAYKLQDKQYIAFDERGRDNIQSCLLQEVQNLKENGSEAKIEVLSENDNAFSMNISRTIDGRTQDIALTPDEMRRAYNIVKESFATKDIKLRLDEIALDDGRFVGLSDNTDFVNDVLARFIDHSETHISYDDNIRNAIDHEFEKRENYSEQSNENEGMYGEIYVDTANISDYAGRVMIIRPDYLKPDMRTPENQLFLAQLGTGCDPKKYGKQIIGVFLYDREEAAIHSDNFLGAMKEEYIPTWAREAREDIAEEEQEDMDCEI